MNLKKKTTQNELIETTGQFISVAVMATVNKMIMGREVTIHGSRDQNNNQTNDNITYNSNEYCIIILNTHIIIHREM